MILRKKISAARKTAQLGRAGFTLMEVLIVVAIIVVLAGVGTFYLMPLLGESKGKIAKAQTHTITQAWEKYSMDNGPPPDLDALTRTQPNGAKALLEPKAIIDPWQQKFQVRNPGEHHGDSGRPDIFTINPDTKETVGNW